MTDEIDIIPVYDIVSTPVSQQAINISLTRRIERLESLAGLNEATPEFEDVVTTDQKPAGGE